MRVVIAAIVGMLAVPAAANPKPPRLLQPRPHVVRVVHRPASTAPTIGPLTAPVTIELFFKPGIASNRTPFDALVKLQAAHPSRVRLVFRIYTAQAHQLSEATAEAHAQGRFFPFMALVNLTRGGTLNEAQILELARGADLDIRALEASWASDRHMAQIDANVTRFKRLRGVKEPDVAFNGKLMKKSLSGVGYDQLEAMYADAYERALDLIDSGVPIESLPEVGALLTEHPVIALTPGSIDDPDESTPLVAPPRLTKRPIDTRGWPSIGPQTAAVPIIVVCNLRSLTCERQVRNALAMQAIFGDDVRVVWGPMFDPASDEAGDTTLIHDAALCAEELGSGWSWVEQAQSNAQRRHGRALDADKEIDTVLAATELDRGALSRCMAASAGASARAVARMRTAGITSGPTIVIGGRMYPGGVSVSASLQQLIDDELEPGVLRRLAPDWTTP